MSYRARLTELVKEKIRLRGPALPATALRLTNEEITSIFVDDVTVDITSLGNFLRVHCQAHDPEVAGGVTRFDVDVAQGEAMQIIFSALLDETRVPVRLDSRPQPTPPITENPPVTGSYPSVADTISKVMREL